jgi:hypothetical protein
MEIDRQLVATARGLINGANVHYVSTWIFCYEVSVPDFPRRARYESLLHDFVRSNASLKAMRQSIQLTREQLVKLNARSAAIKRRVEKLLISHSD